MTSYFDTHRARLERAIEACATRGSWSPFIESPSRKLHPEGALEHGRQEFESYLGKPFPLTMPGEIGRVGEEVSPYTMEPLGIDYPRVDVDTVQEAMLDAMPAWAKATVETRVGICLEILDRLSHQVFTNAFATMHTAGQAFMMAFAGSGANSLDRGLEGIVYAYKAMKDVPTSSTFVRKFGKHEVTLAKRYRLVPRGIALVITCGSYPAWNAYPALFANLATGNPVVVKPHPGGILPMAMMVRTARQVLEEAGFDPNLVTLAADTQDIPATRELALQRDTAIIDFTGSQAFGEWLEENCHHAQVYTETAGTNSVVFESTDDLDGVIGALAQSLSLFCAQMCTAPQNIYLPKDGIQTTDGTITLAEFGERLVAAIEAIAESPKIAAAICGAPQNHGITNTLETLRGRFESEATLLRAPSSYRHPEFPTALTATPLIALVEASQTELYDREHFGPVGILIACDDADDALLRATRDAEKHVSIAAYVYSTDDQFIERAIEAYFDAGASVGVNLIRQSPINYTAAFSDYHVTGLNPAGNASLTDLAFVTNRFRIVQAKVELH